MTRKLEPVILGWVPTPHYAAPAFVVAAHGIRMRFYIDDEAFDRWMATEGDDLKRQFCVPNDDCAGSAVSDLIYEALSARVLLGDPSIELNVHNDGAGYLLRLNNTTGNQQSIGLTRGQQTPQRTLDEPSPSKAIRRCLQEVCDVANALLNDLPIARP